MVHGPGPSGGPWTGGQCYVYTLAEKHSQKSNKMAIFFPAMAVSRVK